MPEEKVKGYCRPTDTLCQLAIEVGGKTECHQGAHDACPYDEQMRLMASEVGEHETIH